MTGHSPKLIAALGKLKRQLESLPEPLRGPFLVKGLGPYVPATAPSDPVEILARALCQIDRLSPDELAPRQLVCGPYGEVLPNWEAYREKAERILAGASGDAGEADAVLVQHRIWYPDVRDWSEWRDGEKPLYDNHFEIRKLYASPRKNEDRPPAFLFNDQTGKSEVARWWLEEMDQVISVNLSTKKDA